MTILYVKVSWSTLLVREPIILFYGLVVLSMTITLHSQICNANWTHLIVCHYDVNYTKGSQFEGNLNTIMNSLIKDTSQTGFNTSVYGQSPDQVYGLLQCRGDTTPDQCYSCSQQANTTILEECENARGGVIWFAHCLLRYETYNFIGQLDDAEDLQSTFITGNVTRADAFHQTLYSLFNNLVKEAPYRPKFYAAGTNIDSLFRSIYALVQCTRDISIGNCKACLLHAISYIVTSFPGSSGSQAAMGSCTVRFETYPFFDPSLSISTADAPAVSMGGTEPNQTTAPSISRQKKSKYSNKLAILLGVAGGMLLVLLVSVFANGKRLKSVIFPSPLQGPAQVQELTALCEDRQDTFTMEKMIAATENFHHNNKLGEGRFGAVYKGTMEDGKEIAVKKLVLKSPQRKEDFLREVKLVARIQHRNIVNTLGCCVEGSERLLVCEYLANKSLDKHLFDTNRRNRLDWRTRYNVIMGVARGLVYLHEDSPLPIIHRDIKASNILLDENLNPKIADFGLATLVSEDDSHDNTRAAGTIGYVAPEYAANEQLSVKVDVYSFGILLLEIITGKKSIHYNLSLELQMLLGWAWSIYKQGNSVNMIDPTIVETCDEEQAVRCIQIGLLCTQESSHRPSISQITLMLSSHYVPLPDPTQPSFVTSQVSDYYI